MYIVITHQKPLEALLMSTHNMHFLGEIRKIFTWYPLLCRPIETPILETAVGPHSLVDKRADS